MSFRGFAYALILVCALTGCRRGGGGGSRAGGGGAAPSLAGSGGASAPEERLRDLRNTLLPYEASAGVSSAAPAVASPTPTATPTATTTPTPAQVQIGEPVCPEAAGTEQQPVYVSTATESVPIRQFAEFLARQLGTSAGQAEVSGWLQGNYHLDSGFFDPQAAASQRDAVLRALAVYPALRNVFPQTGRGALSAADVGEIHRRAGTICDPEEFPDFETQETRSHVAGDES